MRPLQEELVAYTDPDLMNAPYVEGNPIPAPEGYYAHFHHKVVAEHETELTPFIRSTLDEARFLKAEQYSKTILKMSDHEDAGEFREHVLKRETLQEMAYEKQRDHSGHTVSNYLLGWYFFSHSAVVEAAMRPHIRRRYNLSPGFSAGGSVYHDFGTIWTFVSLLHDVGYAFEGSLTKGKVAPAPVKKMAAHISKFFAKMFDMSSDAGMAPLRKELSRICGRSALVIRPGTLAEVSDSMRELGDLTGLWKAVLQARPDWRGRASLPRDAINLWALHYDEFGQPQMAKRMVELEAAHNYQYQTGMFTGPVRLLDHGVMGALMLLQHSTMYFQIVMALKDAKSARSSAVRRLQKHFGLDPAQPAAPYHADHWWAGIVWATAAVALHNIQQFDPWPGFSDSTRRQLKIDDDPLAYLGVLVDVLQEWDRPKSSRGEFFKGKVPISSGNCKLGTSRGKVLLSFGSEQVAEDVAKNLDKALDGWREVVELR